MAPERRKLPVSLRESPKLKIDSYRWGLDSTVPKVKNKMDRRGKSFMIKAMDEDELPEMYVEYIDDFFFLNI